ncbi:MAG: bifunctional lysylphosphatidylglycerol flippase/synthetase MprF [bacterium]|nr:bifunctional lysylphosphatidylglycerol flippase/synthetase MprF [bacterium]
MTKKTLRHLVSAAIGLVLFAGAIWVLRQELESVEYDELVRAARGVPKSHLLWAGLLTVVSYALLTLYDVLALVHIGKRLPLVKVCFTSFTSYVTAHNLGLAGVGGSAVRFRLYSGLGLGASDIATIVAFCGITYWLGFIFVGGLAFSLAPIELPPEVPFGFHDTRGIGWVLMGLFGVYLLATLSARNSYRIYGWTFAPPSFRMMVLQVPLATVDWALSSAIVYILLPPSDMGLLPFFGVYMAAALASLISHVPAGLGVFETIVIVLMPKEIPREEILGGLILYRGVYYLAPLIVGVLAFGAFEVERRGAEVRRLRLYLRPLVEAGMPRIMAVAAFLAGVVLLVSGATPTTAVRLEWLAGLFPLAAIEAAHVGGSLAGTGLLLLSLGLRRRLAAAWRLSVIALAAGVLAELGKGLDWEPATVLAIVLAGLAPTRAAFFRRAPLAEQRLEAGWTFAALVVVLGSFAIARFAHEPVAFEGQPWSRFELGAEASRSLRAAAAALLLFAAFAVRRFVTKPRHVLRRPGAAELERARAVTASSRSTGGQLAQLGDKELLFSDSGDAFVMFGIVGKAWIAMGDPVGPPVQRRELIRAFRETSQQHGGLTAFHAVGEGDGVHYVDAGMALLRIGEEAIVELASHQPERGPGPEPGREPAFELGFEVVPAAEVDGILPELDRIASAWRASRGGDPMGFAFGAPQPAYLRTTDVALVRSAGAPIAFAALWTGSGGAELAIDVVRYFPSAQAEVMEFLFASTLSWGREQGFRGLDLGLVPLAEPEVLVRNPRWNRIGHRLFPHGEHFENAAALRAFKARFGPVWRPRFLASEEGLDIPSAFSDLATLISGGRPRRIPRKNR